jgi:hypothetical protein
MFARAETADSPALENASPTRSLLFIRRCGIGPSRPAGPAKLRGLIRRSKLLSGVPTSEKIG